MYKQVLRVNHSLVEVVGVTTYTGENLTLVSGVWLAREVMHGHV